MVGLVLSAALLLFCIAGGLWGADSRPGLGDEQIARDVRWFPHEKTDRAVLLAGLPYGASE